MTEIGADPRDRVRGEERPRLPGGRVRQAVRRGWKPIGIVIVLFVVLYYPVGMALIHTIDDDLDFRAEPQDLVAGQSYAVATAAALIERETREHSWTANDPWFFASAGLDNMPNFQLGMIEAMSRFGVELLDEIGRVRGSSGADPDLQNAAGRLKISGEKWTWDPSVSIWPQTPAESEYWSAALALRRYNERLTNGNAVFDRRADNLQVVIERISNDLGSVSQAIDDHVRNYAGGFRIDYKVDDEFYRNKGKAYAYYLILRDLGRDFDGVIGERALTRPWNELIGAMRYLAGLDPLVVMNGSPDGLIFPNHLATQGFYLLRVRTKLKEVSNILLK